MSKAKSTALQKDIARFAAVIARKHAMLDGAGKKDLSFIRKHLRKAAEAMNDSARKARPATEKKAKAAPPRSKRERSPQPGKIAPVKPQPPLEPRGED